MGFTLFWIYHRNIIEKFCLAVLIASSLVAIAFSCQTNAETMAPVFESTTPQSSLPRCVNSEVDIAEIQSAQKANSKTSAKYDGYRKVLLEDTDLQLAARLVYAEALAANCPDNEGQVLELIASVIGNRIRIRRGDVKSVVFQRDQFASSLNIYPESRYRDFLCPKNGGLWRAALTKATANLENKKPSAAIPSDTVNYYLYLHSALFNAPSWKLEEVAVADEKAHECIRVFRNFGWK